MHTIAVYGSLKKGKYNHVLLKDSTFIGNTTVRGTMYSLGSYPALLNVGDNEYPAEVYEVSDEVYARIKNMELGAGYKEVFDGYSIHSGGEPSYIKTAIVYYAGKSLFQHCVDNCTVINSY